VVANAGISGRSRDGGPENAEQARAIFEINLGGALNTVLPAMAVMAEQTPGTDGLRGRIVAIASLAAFMAAPDSAAYCASKAAVDCWMVASAPAARRRGVALTSACPGFIRTGMTAGYTFPMPGLMDADRAARVILRGVAAGRRRVVFPWWMGLRARAAGLLPWFAARQGTRSRVHVVLSLRSCVAGVRACRNRAKRRCVGLQPNSLLPVDIGLAGGFGEYDNMPWRPTITGQVSGVVGQRGPIEPTVNASAVASVSGIDPRRRARAGSRRQWEAGVVGIRKSVMAIATFDDDISTDSHRMHVGNGH